MPFLLFLCSYLNTNRKLGVSKSYQCESGYQATARTATCTENGWSPKPLCTEVMCTVPTIENAKTLKKPGTHIEYECLHGYEPDRFTITCNEQGDWDNMRHCSAKTLDCGPPPSIEHAVQDFKEQYKDGETATYDCPSNYIKDGDPYMICSRGRWIGKGKCLPTTLDCGRPPQIEDAIQDFKFRYEDGEKAAYACPAFYVKEGDLTCTRGRWTGSGKCWRPCTVDLKAMGDRKLQLKYKDTEKIYSTHGDFIEFLCKGGYRRGKDSVPFRQRCTNGHINLPVCE
ncbi:hypothetical protein SRHO_G00168130 [Serrasalmus rhombeus]